MELKILVEQNFNLEKVVCNYGFFMMCPNHWLSSTKSFQRPLRLADGSSSVIVSISQPIYANHLLIHIQDIDSLDLSDQEVIQKQIVRMLRITNKDNEVASEFQDMYDEAKKTGFGRLFRSPDLFEDIVKTILLCNTTWQRSLQMCRALCELQAELHLVDHNNDALVADDGELTIADYFRKRKRELKMKPCERTSKTTSSKAKTLHRDKSKSLGNFPTSKELVSLSENFLKTRCNLGYRAKFIVEMANMVENHELRLEEFEIQAFNKTLSQKTLKKLEELNGIGEFSAANILMCLGDYRHIPIDSETINHLREVHGRKNCTKATVKKVVKQVYDKYAPYQCLAYWCEHCEYYEKELGEKMSKLAPSSYHKVSGSYLSNNTPEKKKKNI